MASSSPRRVVVTGIGLVTPLGTDRESSWHALQQGQCGLRWLDSSHLNEFGASVPPASTDLRFAGGPAPPSTNESSDSGELIVDLALQAAREAWEDACLDSSALNPARAGCVVGTSKGGLRSFTRAWQTSGQQSADENLGRWWNLFFPHTPATTLSQQFHLEGPSLCPVAACATGLAGIVRAADLIRDGSCDVVLAGSTDASLQASVLGSFRRLGVLARRFDNPASACRPFDWDRQGFLIGEGAALFVLESLPHALDRGAQPYAEYLAGGLAADPSGMTGLEDNPRSLVRLIQDVLGRANLTSDELDYVNLHGTATRQNDLCETRALKQALGSAAKNVPTSSIKGALGHLLGAAGSVELAATLLAMRDRTVPPTLNLQQPDPQCDLDFTPQTAREHRIEHALKLSLGFGGHLVAATLRKWQL